MQNLFWPIYKQLESEFTQLSYYISIDRIQLKTYSVKIADLILRTVSECENISKELCKKEGIKFKDKKGRIRKLVYFNEYIDKLDEIYDLSSKSVDFVLDNVREDPYFDSIMPFYTSIRIIKGVEKDVLNWYHAYNQIKHDRIKNYKEANLGNLIDALAALFILNIYYIDMEFYNTNNYDIDFLIQQIEKFSSVFRLEYAVILKDDDIMHEVFKDYTYNPVKIMKNNAYHCVYLIQYDKECKTNLDKSIEVVKRLDLFCSILNMKYKNDNNYQFERIPELITKCKVVAFLNKSIY